MHNEIGWHGCQIAMLLRMVASYDMARCSCKYMRNYLPYHHNCKDKCTIL